MRQAFTHDVYENLTVLIQMVGPDDMAYRRQVAYYRAVAEELGFIDALERVVADVYDEHSSGTNAGAQTRRLA